MDNDQTPINGDLERRPELPAPVERRPKLPAVLEDVALTLEDKVFWRLGDGIRSAFEVVRWPVERFAWALQRSLWWPLEDRAGELDGRGRALAAGGGVVVAAVAVGALALASSGGSSTPAPAPVAVVAKPAAKLAPAPTPKPPAPTLHGAAPVFKAPATKGSSKVGSAKPIETSPAQTSSADTAASSSAATGKISSDPSASTATGAARPAQTSSVDGPPAGKEAIAVAREFSEAFVSFEIGREEAGVSKGFAKTATPQLTKALLKRPPRLPANVKVPKAKVVNVVAGPSNGGVYTLSVSLLRVGVTSELRLEMEKLKGKGWRVTNVLG